MSAKLVVWAILGILVVSAGPGTAMACDGPYLSRSSMAWVYLPSTGYTREHIPYFALHPPVYYSYVVRRPYGYSPYAWPPMAATTKSRPKRPIVVQNPYVNSEVAGVSDRDRTPKKPLRIVNPYVVPGNRSGHGQKKR